MLYHKKLSNTGVHPWNETWKRGTALLIEETDDGESSPAVQPGVQVGGVGA
jgi:hypothetical protein